MNLSCYHHTQSGDDESQSDGEVSIFIEISFLKNTSYTVYVMKKETFFSKQRKVPECHRDGRCESDWDKKSLSDAELVKYY